MYRLLPYVLLVVSLLFTAQALPVLTARRTPTSYQDDVFTGRQGSPSITKSKPDSKKVSNSLTASQVSQPSTAPKSPSPQFSYDAIPGKAASQASSNSKKVSGRYSDNPSTNKEGSQPPIAQNEVATDGATNGSTGTLNGSTGKDGSQAGSSQNVPISLDGAPKPK
jgi:hypothetical protein